MSARASAGTAGTQLTERVLDVFGMKLPALETGARGSGEAVVFLHGHPGSSRDWIELLRRVGEFGRAVAFDLPGLGKADKPGDWDYGIGMYGGAVAGALHELGVTRAHLVMHDLGGGAGLSWAATHPDAFASAVIMSTGVLIDYKWHPLAAMQRRPLLGEVMARFTDARSFRMVMRRFSPRLPEEFISQLWQDYDLASRRAMVRMYRASPPSGFERLAPLFRELDRPALALWGGKDPFVPTTQAYRQRESFPSAEVVILEDCGHWSWMEDLEAVAQHMLPFLQNQLHRVPQHSHPG